MASGYTLLFSLFVHGGGPAPLAVLFELYFALDELFIFGAPVVNALALVALEFYESVLGHKIGARGAWQIYPKRPSGATRPDAAQASRLWQKLELAPVPHSYGLFLLIGGTIPYKTYDIWL